MKKSLSNDGFQKRPPGLPIWVIVSLAISIIVAYLVRGASDEAVAQFISAQVTFLSVTGGILLAVLAVSGDFSAITHFSSNQLRLERLHVDHNVGRFTWMIFLFLLASFALSGLSLVPVLLSEEASRIARQVVIALSVWAGLLSFALPWVLRAAYLKKFRRMQDKIEEEKRERLATHKTPRP